MCYPRRLHHGADRIEDPDRPEPAGRPAEPTEPPEQTLPEASRKAPEHAERPRRES